MKREERLGQTWLVNDSKMKTKKPWIARRSTLEYWLAGTCFIFLALIVVLLVALSRDSAPVEPEWGNWAKWAGVAVTSFGFVGAIITVYMQGRSVRIQEEQHEESKNEKDAKAAAAERAAAKDARKIGKNGCGLSISRQLRSISRNFPDRPALRRMENSFCSVEQQCEEVSTEMSVSSCLLR